MSSNSLSHLKAPLLSTQEQRNCDAEQPSTSLAVLNPKPAPSCFRRFCSSIGGGLAACASKVKSVVANRVVQGWTARGANAVGAVGIVVSSYFVRATAPASEFEPPSNANIAARSGLYVSCALFGWSAQAMLGQSRSAQTTEGSNEDEVCLKQPLLEEYDAHLSGESSSSSESALSPSSSQESEVTPLSSPVLHRVEQLEPSVSINIKLDVRESSAGEGAVIDLNFIVLPFSPAGSEAESTATSPLSQVNSETEDSSTPPSVVHESGAPFSSRHIEPLILETKFEENAEPNNCQELGDRVKASCASFCEGTTVLDRVKKGCARAITYVQNERPVEAHGAFVAVYLLAGPVAPLVITAMASFTLGMYGKILYDKLGEKLSSNRIEEVDEAGLPIREEEPTQTSTATKVCNVVKPLLCLGLGATAVALTAQPLPASTDPYSIQALLNPMFFKLGLALLARPFGQLAAHFSNKAVRILEARNPNGLPVKIAKVAEFICENPSILVVSGYGIYRDLTLVGDVVGSLFIGLGLGCNDEKFARTPPKIELLDAAALESAASFGKLSPTGKTIYIVKNYWGTGAALGLMIYGLVPPAGNASTFFLGGLAANYATSLSRRHLSSLQLDLPSNSKKQYQCTHILSERLLQTASRVKFDLLATGLLLTFPPTVNLISLATNFTGVGMVGAGMGIAREEIQSSRNKDAGEFYKPV